LQEQFDLQTAVVAAELALPPLIELYPPSREVGALARQPGIERDLSIIVEESVRWQQIAGTLEQTNPALLESLTFLDTYRGKPIAKGQKSVSFRMLFRDPQRTLRHEEVDPQVNSVVEALKQQLNAELRG
jgi:phenylalanyl-tRNA synthetase beta chain